MEMIGSLLKGVVKSYLDSTFELLKIKAVICYINGIKSARRIFLLWFFLVFCLVLLAVGLGLIPVVLCLFMPWPQETKAIVVIVFTAVYVIVPLAIMLICFSQKRWMKISGANDLMKDVLDRK